MSTWVLAACVAGGYVVGAASMARLVVRIFAHGRYRAGPTELRLEGAEHTMHLATVSASSVSVQLGSRLGFATYVLDVLKILVPALVLKHTLPGTYAFIAFAAGGMLGHVFPVFHGFKGGRGISTAYAGLLAISGVGFLACSLGGMLFGLVVMRDVWTAYCAGVWAMIPWVWFTTGDTVLLIYAVFVNIVFMLGMIPETRQWFRIRRENKWNDTTEVMQLSGMGRGLLKMARRFGLVKAPEREREDDRRGA
jgi:glycerol-3-phosphate acyltransferase PlsY